MKKIGLLTCYMDNYGACLQAYALQQKINSCDCQCEIIKYTPVFDVQEHNEICNLYLKIKDIYRLIKYKNYSSMLKRKRKFEKFRNTYLYFSEKYYRDIDSLYGNLDKYNGFVCVSDQLWNPLIHENKNNKAYFLDFANSNQLKIAYAPSIGISELPDECKQEFKNLVKKFDYLSVRESQGSKIIKEIAGLEAKVVLDPTLLLTKEEWRKVEKKVENIPNEYIFCYIFGDNEYIREYIHHIRNLTGLPIVMLPFNQKDIDNEENINLYDIGPDEFIWLIDNAKLVLTDSFHATAFSINMNIPFYSLLRNKTGESNNMNSRIFNILKMFNLENRLIKDGSNFNEFSYSLDFTDVNKEIEKRRKLDFSYLKEALSNGKDM